MESHPWSFSASGQSSGLGNDTHLHLTRGDTGQSLPFPAHITSTGRVRFRSESCPITTRSICCPKLDNSYLFVLIPHLKNFISCFLCFRTFFFFSCHTTPFRVFLFKEAHLIHIYGKVFVLVI